MSLTGNEEYGDNTSAEIISNFISKSILEGVKNGIDSAGFDQTRTAQVIKVNGNVCDIKADGKEYTDINIYGSPDMLITGSIVKVMYPCNNPSQMFVIAPNAFVAPTQQWTDSGTTLSTTKNVSVGGNLTTNNINFSALIPSTYPNIAGGLSPTGNSSDLGGSLNHWNWVHANQLRLYSTTTGSTYSALTYDTIPASGSVSITPTANVTTAKAFIFGKTFSSTPVVVANAVTITPESVSVSVAGISTTGCTAYLRRTTATATTIHWTAQVPTISQQ